jgi:hypothetical protein
MLLDRIAEQLNVNAAALESADRIPNLLLGELGPW